MSIVLVGSTSGSITLQEPAVSGSTVLSLPAVTGTILTDTSPKAGNVIQVVNVTYSTQTSTTSTSYIDTGLSASITPTSSSNKILVLVSQAGVGKESGGTGQRVHIRLMRGASQLFEMEKLAGYTAANDTNVIGSVSTSYLDSPATTSSVTYKTQFYNDTGSGLVYVNWNNGTSTITLMEIAG
jgi:hypothetical protein